MTELISTDNTTLAHSLRHDIDLLFSDIQLASEKTFAVTQQAEDFSNRGFWAQISGSFSGRNDTDLSLMIGSVSESLQITQRVVEILLKVQSEKNVVLKDFHRAVTDKIMDLQSNDNTLDLSLRDNLLTVFEHLQKQVEDKLEQSATLEAHKTKIAKFEYELQQQEAFIAQTEQAMKTLRAQLEQTTTQLDVQTHTINQLQETLGHASTQMAAMQSNLTHTQATLATTENQINNLRTKALSKRDYLLFATSTLSLATAIGVWILGVTPL